MEDKVLKLEKSGTRLEDLNKSKGGITSDPQPFIGKCGSIHACLNCGVYNQQKMEKSYMDWCIVDF